MPVIDAFALANKFPDNADRAIDEELTHAVLRAEGVQHPVRFNSTIQRHSFTGCQLAPCKQPHPVRDGRTFSPSLRRRSRSEIDGAGQLSGQFNSKKSNVDEASGFFGTAGVKSHLCNRF
jgi:hypothetical protein